jgi:predicted nucleic acid-binding Zn ribbon protein
MAFPQPLSGVMQESLVGLGLAERLREAEIWRVWPEVVGATLAYRAQPLRIINGTLTVSVSSAPWMQELRFMTAMMKEKLNSRLGDEVVREIVLKAGRVAPPVVAVQEEVSVPRPLTDQQHAAIEAQSAVIADPETRQAFIALMQASMEQQR